MSDLDKKIDISIENSTRFSENEQIDTRMEDIYIADINTPTASSEYYPKSNRLLTAIILIIMACGAYVLGLVLAKVPVIDLPYSAMVDFYNITAIMPAQSVPKVWDWLVALELVSLGGVNKAIAGIGLLVYCSLVLWVYAIFIEGIGIMIARLYEYDRPDISAAFKLYFLPLLICSLHFIIMNLVAILRHP